jgi:hypothetical protein
MRNRLYRTLPITAVALPLLVACQTHLPALDSVDSTPPKRPRTSDVIDHVQCELAKIVNQPTANAQMAKRLTADQNLKTLVGYMVQYNFVATIQITLEVTDMEGLTPSLSFMNAATTHAVGLGGQWNGTQDRSVTINYSIDLAHLRDPKAPWDPSQPKDSGYWSTFCKSTPTGGIDGDLGLADIVADGLTGLDASSTYNVYGSAGPTPAAVAKLIDQGGEIAADSTKSLPKLDISIKSLQGSILLAPQSASAQTQGTVTLSGVATLKEGDKEGKYIVNWSGSVVPPDALSADGKLYFSLSGGLLPESDTPLAQESTKLWGFSPTLNLTGSIDTGLLVTNLHFAGVLVPAAGSTYAKSTDAPPIKVTLEPTAAAPGAGGPPAAGAVKGGSPPGGASAGGTSFGSLVDFVLVYGLNGSPSYTFQNVKGLTGMGMPFVNVMRTHTDSVAITFVATCQKSDHINQFNADSYWHSIGPCDEFGVAQDQAKSFGYQNNSLMFLRNLFVR